MSQGVDRADVEYVWPRTLVVPPRPPKLVYLDLNHWIDLSKAYAGHQERRVDADLLDFCIQASANQTAVFPISDTIYFEVSKITHHRQRRDLREVIEKISQYSVVTARSVVATHEIEAVLDSLVGPNPSPINQMDYVDWGVARAFGMVGGFRIKSADGHDVTDEVRADYEQGPETFDWIMAEAELGLNRSTLDGPTPEEEPELRKHGWNPRAAFEIARQRAEQELEQVKRFNEDPSWRKGRIRDVVAAREVFIEINETLWKGLSDRGVSLESVTGDLSETRHIFDSMPSFDVAVTLKASLHRNPSHRWRPNDIHDIDALGSTLPYCDIVATDKAMAAHATRTGLAERLSTVVLSSLSDLPDCL